MVRLDPQYRLVFGAGGELWHARRRPDGRAIAALSPRDATPASAVPGRQPRQDGRVPQRPRVALPELARPALAAAAEAASPAPPVALARRRAGRLFPRPADAAGLHVPVEIPGHVAVQLPEPVLDPLVPGIRVRRLPSRRRLRRGLRGDGRGPPRTWARDLARRGGRRRSCSRAAAPWACDRDRASTTADAAGDQRRLRPRHDEARAGPPPPPLDRPRRSPARSSPARPSCSTSGIEGRYDDLAHHTIYIAEDYRQNLARDREAARAVRRSVVLRPERLRHRPVAGAAGQEHALRARCR